MSTAAGEQGQCQVRSGTNNRCLRPAVVEMGGIPFCKRCAREQEAYFAIGELTDAPERFRDERLVELLAQVWRTTTLRREARASDPVAPKAVA